MIASSPLGPLSKRMTRICPSYYPKPQDLGGSQLPIWTIFAIFHILAFPSFLVRDNPLLGGYEIRREACRESFQSHPYPFWVISRVWWRQGALQPLLNGHTITQTVVETLVSVETLRPVWICPLYYTNLKTLMAHSNQSEPSSLHLLHFSVPIASCQVQYIGGRKWDAAGGLRESFLLI